MATALAQKGIWKNSIVEIISDFGISQSIFARLIDVPETTVFRWIKGVCAPQKVYQERIMKLQYIDRELRKSLKGEYIPGWLNTPIDYLGGDRPIDAFKKGEYDKVLQLLAYIEGDIFL